MALTRSELIAALAERLPYLHQNGVDRATRILIEFISATISSGRRIEIRGFGVFSVHYHLPTQKRNPKTGEAVAVGAKAVIHFRPGKELRERLTEQTK